MKLVSLSDGQSTVVGWSDGNSAHSAIVYCAAFHAAQLAQVKALRLFHERYGADRGANQRRNRSLARRVPSRDNDKRIKR
ncbi:TPA: hypothetical protein MIY08_29105 [Klebsiella pneumoniae]|nr:hypothetical protein [Klebsiella pneumoniae]